MTTDRAASGGSETATDLLDDIEKDSSISLMDPSTMQEVLQAINGHASSSGSMKDRQIKRQRRGNRMKVYDNGYIFTYDKDSQCGQRSFWRCERKSECQARVHTNPATNQIIKRINEHTHEPPSREDLPPWLVLSQTTSDTSDDGGASGSGRESTTGILLNANYSSSANTQLSNMVERELDSVEAPLNIMPADIVKQEPLEHSTSPPPKKRKRNSTKKEDVAGALELMNSCPEQFWEIYDLTKKTIKFIQDGGAVARSSPERSSVPCSSAVSDWLEAQNLGEYKSCFSKYSMDALRQLSSSDCTSICQNDADGLLLYHSLKTSSGAEASSSSTSSTAPNNQCMIVFIASKIADGDDEPLYQQISLHQKTPTTLQSQMEQRGLLPSDRGVTRFCVAGPGGIKVELNEEMMAAWAPDSVFQFEEKRGGVCLLERIS